jgi:hypothetical protein
LFPFIKKFKSVEEILTSHTLAALGDAFVNFVYSLALSKKKNRPVGVRAKGSVLSKSLKDSGLRGLLPSRMDSHKQADAAEALIVYAWMRQLISIDEIVSILSEKEEAADAFTELLVEIKRRIDKKGV